jgi:hypothetical protein
MSLIGEALQRARLEAARRDAEERGTVYSGAPAYVPAASRKRRGPAWVFLAAGVVLGVGAGAAIFFAGRRPGPASVPPNAAEAQPAAVASEPTAAPAESPYSPPPASSPAPQPTPPGPAVGQVGSSSPARLEAPSVATATVPQPSQATAAQPQKLVSGRTYLRVVLLPSGGRLELDGIVASDTEPLTMINRQLVGLGEEVQGFAVEEIEPNRVKLRDRNGVVVYLRLRETPEE